MIEPQTLTLALSRFAGEGALPLRRHNRVPSSAKRERAKMRVCDSALDLNWGQSPSHPGVRSASPFTSANIHSRNARIFGTFWRSRA
jgi:hypothetical protein